MEHIPTTATAVQKLKRAAKTRRKTTGESLAVALESVARDAGYASWKHVTVCEAATERPTVASPPIPEAVKKFLDQERAAKAARPELLEALKSGLLFAMDIKDADSVAPENSEDIEESEDARPYLAGEIWAAMHEEEHEGRAPELSSEPAEVLQEFFDDLGNYRFFRYVGASTPKSLDDAFATVFRDFFFPPTHVWLAGKFIDMADVREVRVDGKVIYSTSPGGPAPDAPQAPASTPTQPPRPSSPGGTASSGPERPFIARLDVRKWQPGLYEYIVSYGREELDSDAGFNSISEALKAASEGHGGDLAGFEVSYAGFIVGTYAVDVLRTTAEEVAQRAVDTASSLRWQ